MSTALWFIVFFTVFSLVRLGLATLFFWAVLPEDDHCPNCDAPTIRVQSRGWNLLMPWFRTSYCVECQWEGMLRSSAVLTRDRLEDRTDEPIPVSGSKRPAR